MVGRHHPFNGHELGQTPGDGEGQGGLARCSLWGHRELDCKEGRTPKNLFLWTVVLEKTPESPLDSKEIKPVNLKGN